jgi:hypothetical protein
VTSAASDPLRYRQTRPGPSEIVTQVRPFGHAVSFSHRISQLLNSGPRVPANP